MRPLPARPAWKKLTPEQRLAVAKTAAKVGICAAAFEHVVSPGAVRFACASLGIAPKTGLGLGQPKAQRIACAKSILRTLRLTVADLS